MDTASLSCLWEPATITAASKASFDSWDVRFDVVSLDSSAIQPLALPLSPVL